MKKVEFDEMEHFDEMLARRRYICELLGTVISSQMKIINVGAGTGWVELFLVEKVIDGQLVALEPDVQTREALKRNVKKHGVTVPELVDGVIPFADGYFDLCVSFDVIEHVSKGTEQEFLKELFRVVRPGGLIILSTPNKGLLINLLDPAYYFGHRHYSAGDFENWAKKLGISLNKTWTGGTVIDLLWLYNVYVTKWIFRRMPFFKRTFQKLSNRWYISRFGFLDRYAVFVR